MTINTFEELFVHELRDLYDAEHQMLAGLSKMEEAASTSELKAAFRKHKEQTDRQRERLERVFQKLGIDAERAKCYGMAGMIQEAQELIKEGHSGKVRDAGLIAAAQRVEHYEMAGYGTVCQYAQRLGYSDVAQLLQETLDEEAETDRLLNGLAVDGVNREAMAQG